LAALAAGDGAELTHNESNTKLSKSARAYAKTYKPGPPLVPSLVVDRIMNYIGKVTLRKKSDFVLLMCKYWSLKREARRGAPLLKRLHLEPWTASTGLKVQTDEEKGMKLEVRMAFAVCPGNESLISCVPAFTTAQERFRVCEGVGRAEPEA